MCNRQRGVTPEFEPHAELGTSISGFSSFAPLGTKPRCFQGNTSYYHVPGNIRDRPRISEKGSFRLLSALAGILREIYEILPFRVAFFFGDGG